MRIQEFVDGDTTVVLAELPGMDPEKDIDLTVAEGVLTISAERLEEFSEVREPAGSRSESHYESFRRRLALPAGTTADDIRARFGDGVLEVRVPRHPAGGRRLP
jgi:HSP20 family protein